MKYLYEKDAFCRSFTAKVLACEPSQGKGQEGYEVELDDTAFYPEGGGQPCDLGTLYGCDVLAVYKKEGKVIHLVSAACPLGAEVEGKIDWQRRFDLMQQHSGEHIVSGIAHRLYGCDNVGFHMGKDMITIDFNKELTWAQVEDLERQANEYIWENHPVEISYPLGEALENLDYRSKIALSGQVRIVTFPQNGDCCACCGTHVERSGQIGLVKLFSCQKFRDGVRIELLCGRRALAHLSEHRQENLAISKLLSAKPLETAQNVARILKEKEKQDQLLLQMEKKQVATLVAEYEGRENPILFLEEISLEALRILATELAKVTTGVAFCFLAEESGFRYALATKEGDVRPIVKMLNESCSGRGGGKPNLAQGSLSGEETEIKAVLSSVIT